MSIQLTYPDYLSDDQRALTKTLVCHVSDPQSFIDIAAWAERNGGKGRFLDVLSWVTYEYNLMSPDYLDDKKYIQFWINEWISGNPMANRPDWAADDEGEYEFSFPVQTSLCEQWQALHQLREIVIIDLAINRQTLLNAWAWRLHQAEKATDAMHVFNKICGEFPVEAWRYPTTDIFSFQLPAGDYQPIIRDAKQWQHYLETVHNPKVDMLISALQAYEKAIADFDDDQNEQVILYQQYKRDWERLTGKSWRKAH